MLHKRHKAPVNRQVSNQRILQKKRKPRKQLLQHHHTCFGIEICTMLCSLPCQKVIYTKKRMLCFFSINFLTILPFSYYKQIYFETHKKTRFQKSLSIRYLKQNKKEGQNLNAQALNVFQQYLEFYERLTSQTKVAYRSRCSFQATRNVILEL